MGEALANLEKTFEAYVNIGASRREKNTQDYKDEFRKWCSENR